MKNAVDKQIERDCVKQMRPCFALHCFRETLSFTLPVITSWMIGDMADALLRLDAGRLRGNLAVFAAAFMLNVLAQPAVELWENLLMTRLGFAYGNQMYGRYLRLPMKAAKAVDTATLVERIDAGTTDYYFLLMQKRTRPLTMAVYLAALAAMFAAEAFHPLYILVMSALAAIPLLRAGRNGKAKAKLKEERLAYEEARKGMEYAMFGARDFLNGFHIGKRYILRLHNHYLKYAGKTGAKQDRIDGADAMFGYLCTYGVPLGAAAAGALLIAGGRMGAGALLAGCLIMPTVTAFYETFAGLILNFHEEKTVRSRLEIFYSGREDGGGQIHPKELRLDGVTFSYSHGGKAVFTKQSLTLPLTGVVRLRGPNGAGKSTLLTLLSGVYAPQAGRITDEAGKNLTCGSLRAAVSLLEQDGALFAVTAAENLFIPPEKLGQAARLLRALGFDKPLDTALEEGGANLSPGERKKLLLTRALLKDARILALDEPLNHLDAWGAQALAECLAEEKRPILLVSHTPPAGLAWKRLAL